MERSAQIYRMMPTRNTRRRIVYAALGFCAFIILYIVFYGDPDSTIHVNAMESASYLAGSVIIGYAVSAVADNGFVYSRQRPVIMGQKRFVNVNPNYGSFDHSYGQGTGSEMYAGYDGEDFLTEEEEFEGRTAPHGGPLKSRLASFQSTFPRKGT